MEQLELTVKIAIDNWNATLTRTNGILRDISDEDMLCEVCPGRNTGIYLLGHLVAVHDKMLQLLGIGDQRYPHLMDIFVNSADKAGHIMPPVAELRAKWEEINGALAAGFNGMQPGDWFERHTAVSAEDFAKQPHRNKLNLLLSRAIHLGEHYGQLLFLKKKA